MNFGLPARPEFPREMLDYVRERKDPRPILFEWYRYAGILSHLLSGILYESPAYNAGSKEMWATISACWLRISRLISTNLELFQNEVYIESTYIIDRCLLETACRIIWLSNDKSENEDRHRRFVEGSIQIDREYKKIVEENIANRSGIQYPIEARILDRIAEFEAKAGTAEVPDSELQRLPNLWRLMEQIGFDRLEYSAIGKLGSQAVHGSWQHLFERFMRLSGDEYEIHFNEVESNPSQYFVAIVLIFRAVKDYSERFFSEEDYQDISTTLAEFENEISKVYYDAVESDWTVG